MRLDAEKALFRAGESDHGVLCTLHPERGVDAVPAVFALLEHEWVGVPIDRVKAKAMGQEVLRALSPDQQLVKIVHEELTATMGGAAGKLDLSGEPPAAAPAEPAFRLELALDLWLPRLEGEFNDNGAKVDVRDVDEWIAESSSPYGKDFCPRKGRIPGARWIEWYRMMKPTGEGQRVKGKDEVLAECATVGVTPETPVYLYCFKGARASNTFLALKNAGVKALSFSGVPEVAAQLMKAFDAVLLAAAVDARPGERILDLGAGVASVGLCLAARVPDCRIVGIELQDALVALAERNAALNRVTDRVRTFRHDLAQPLPDDLGLFDHVVANPPYLPAAMADPSPNPIKALATVESSADLDRWLDVAISAASSTVWPINTTISIRSRCGCSRRFEEANP